MTLFVHLYVSWEVRNSFLPEYVAPHHLSRHCVFSYLSLSQGPEGLSLSPPEFHTCPGPSLAVLCCLALRGRWRARLSRVSHPPETPQIRVLSPSEVSTSTAQRRARSREPPACCVTPHVPLGSAKGVGSAACSARPFECIYEGNVLV